MPRDRLLLIKKYLHFLNLNDASYETTADRYFRVRPTLDILHETFHEAVDPPEHQSLDQMLISFKGRSALKQYLRNKPIKWGFKVGVRASPNGYVHCFQAYQPSETKKSTYGPIADCVLSITHGLENKNPKLFMDNLFTAYELLKYFDSKPVYVHGTLQLNRFHKIRENLAELQKLKAARGSKSLATSKKRWLDNNEVQTASTYAGVETTDITRRWDRKTKTRTSVSRLFCISEYNNFMGEVDLLVEW